MATISSGDIYPKAFYDNGGGSYGGIQPNKIMTGTLQGDVKVGVNGPVLSPSTNSITVPSSTGGAPIIINGGGISVGGITIGTPTALPYTPIVKGPFLITSASGNIRSGNGAVITSFSPGDIILSCLATTTKTWNQSTFLAIGYNFANSVDPSSDAMISPQVSYTLPGVPANSAAYQGLVSGGDISTTKGALVLTSNSICARATSVSTDTQGTTYIIFVYVPYGGGTQVAAS